MAWRLGWSWSWSWRELGRVGGDDDQDDERDMWEVTPLSGPLAQS